MDDNASLLDLELLYEHAPCGLVTSAADGRLTRVNDTFCQLVGHERSALLGGMSLSDLLPVGGRIYLETHVRPLLELTGRAAEIALDLVRADGSRTPVLTSAVLERDASGQVVAVHTVLFDARERRSYERELLHERQRAEDAERRATELVRTLQRTLIPPLPPVIPGLDLATAYRPAGDGEEVGGDFFDVFEVADGEWVVIVGDVRGKGVEAAVLTALIRHSVRAASMVHRLPSEVLAELNRTLLDAGTDRFCTAALVRLRPEGHRWSATVCSGGHPLVVRTGPDGRVQDVGRPGSLLGVFEQVVLEDTAVALGPGEGLVLYTDGTTEARRGGELYEIERLHAQLARDADGPAQRVEHLLADVLAYQAGHASDDIVLVALETPRS